MYRFEIEWTLPAWWDEGNCSILKWQEYNIVKQTVEVERLGMYRGKEEEKEVRSWGCC